MFQSVRSGDRAAVQRLLTVQGHLVEESPWACEWLSAERLGKGEHFSVFILLFFVFGGGQCSFVFFFGGGRGGKHPFTGFAAFLLFCFGGRGGGAVLFVVGSKR